MTGPEHYRKAEELAVKADSISVNSTEYALVLATLAVTHASLAGAAATSLGHYNGQEMPMPQDDRAAWLACASEKPGADARRRENDRAEMEEASASA